jgi:PAS domain S-box-containing protein
MRKRHVPIRKMSDVSKSSNHKPFAASAEMLSILEHSERSILVMDAQYRILWFNSRAAATMTRFYGEELKSGYTYWDYVDRDSNLRFIRNFELALKGRRVSIERRVGQEGAYEVWMEGTFSPLNTADGTVSGVIYSYQNISQRKREEKEARYRENIVRAIDNNESQAFALLDEGDNVVSCNRVASALLASGKGASTVEGKRILDCLEPSWKERFLGGLKMARAGGTISVEFERMNPNQQTVEIRFCPVNAHGEASMVSIWAFDITDKKNAEREVRMSEENLRSVFNSSSQTFYLLDHELNIIAFNEPAKAIVKEQYGRELSIGDNVSAVTPPERMPQFLAETARAFEGKRVQVEKHFSKNGKAYWFERHINPIRNSHGVVDRVALWSIDITDRKKAEEALRENEAKFRKLAAIMPVGIYQTDANGNTTYVNESLQNIVKASVTELISGEWKHQIHPDDVNSVSETWSKASMDFQPFELEYRVVDKQGKITNVLEQALPLYNNQKEYNGYLGTVIDLTAQRTNQILMQEKDVAERSLRFRSDFLASMSHEIRTPLTGILGMTELLLGSQLTPDQRQSMENIFKASSDLRSIVNDVLHLSELEAGKITLNEELFALDQLLKQIQERYSSEASAKGISLRVDNRAGDMNMFSDRRRITQILSNLTRNAIKFTDAGDVRVVVLQVEEGLRFEIHDTGVGIPEDELHKLFKDFSQLQHTTAQNMEGTGLGLSITRKLATILGGSVGVESQLGKGSMFWFQLPLSHDKLGAFALNQAPDSPVEAREVGKSILLVEDNLINQQAFRAMLRKMGCSVTLASNGEEAIAAYDRGGYDLIFMDIQMPVMDGIEATQRIRDKGLPAPPIIGLSGNILERDEQGNLTVPMDDLLVKPVISRELERMIHKWTDSTPE